MVDAQVRQKCSVLFRQWANAYGKTPGLERVAQLYKQTPKSKKIQPHQSRVVRENEAEAARDYSPPNSPFGDPASSSRGGSLASSSRPVSLASTRDSQMSGSSIFKKDKKDKKNKLKPFNLEKEKQQMLETIASASVASTNLLNALKLINRESEQVSDNQEVMRRFETCKQLRRQILRYIHLVESEQWIGSLLTANDDLVKALIAFEVMDKSIEDDSDSDTDAHGAYEAHKAEFQRRTAGHRETEEALAGLNLNENAPPAKPPRPGSIGMPPVPPTAFGKQQQEDSEPEEDEDDPFGDQYAAKTPKVEKDGMTW